MARATASALRLYLKAPGAIRIFMRCAPSPRQPDEIINGAVGVVGDLLRYSAAACHQEDLRDGEIIDPGPGEGDAVARRTEGCQRGRGQTAEQAGGGAVA